MRELAATPGHVAFDGFPKLLEVKGCETAACGHPRLIASQPGDGQRSRSGLRGAPRMDVGLGVGQSECHLPDGGGPFTDRHARLFGE